MKGFVCIAQGVYVNKGLIDNEKTHYYASRDKVVVFDIYGNKYLVEKDLAKAK